MPVDAYTLLHGDCLERLRTLPDNSVDAVVTDPPYGLSFMGKRWDYDVPSVDIWTECLRVLKPGGHLLAFAGTRTQHRMAVRIEDAGFEIRDMIAWVYGSGFPKSHNLDGQWQGWGTALKPALEPITVARKPLIGTVADNVLEHGTGALNVDGCRVGAENMSEQFNRDWKQDGTFGNGKRASYGKQCPPGRWPANLIHDGSEEVVELFPATGPAKAGRRNPNGKKNTNAFGDYGAQPDAVGGHNDNGGSAARFFYCAKASKADRDEGLDGFRAVKHTTGLCKEENTELAESLQKAMCESIVKWDIDESGASITGLCQLASLSTTLTEISKITTSQICSLLTPSRTRESTADANCETEHGGSPAGNAISSNQSAPSTTNASRAESAHGASHAVSKMLSSISDGANWIPASNFHATVKPADLMRYLCRLVTPPGGVVLDPFMGSGSTGKAAILEGFRFIGCEREAEYLDIARARIEAAVNERAQELPLAAS